MQQGMEVKELRFNCSGCAAPVEYEPGTASMKCPFCGKEQAIQAPQRPISEHDIAELEVVPRTEAQGFGTDARYFKCDKCGATSTLSGGQMTARCAFCDSPVVVEVPPVAGMVMPESLVPFAVNKDKAIQLYRDWIAGLWFRPSDLKKRADLAKLDGCYVPHFTFDANANSQWSGYAGHYYYETESYSAMENGRSVRKTRQVRKVRWQFRSGTHAAFYDDVLVNASMGLPQGMLARIHPYHLTGLVPYAPSYLSGFKAEAYSVDPRSCWQTARGEMQGRETQACSTLLDGDTQRDLVVNTDYQGVRWKHLLLPVYVSSYLYGAKTFSFMVNGQTGEVQGDAPYSWAKIGAVVAVVAVAVAVVVAKLGGLF
jgi:LSD1 subclass zinc finger protein